MSDPPSLRLCWLINLAMLAGVAWMVGYDVGHDDMWHRVHAVIGVVGAAVYAFWFARTNE